MSRKNESTQKAAMQEMMKNYLKDTNTNVHDGADVKNVMRDSVKKTGAMNKSL
ncbi:hypothetical protein [Pectinatus frisingensis]|uniref:hypothetical protein n=1 Tax=Pectinatus frisingensis TaxID=865 RepID=UPI0018C45DE5|nr:hypothetical protein [Pectinatus frisingensis]